MQKTFTELSINFLVPDNDINFWEYNPLSSSNRTEITALGPEDLQRFLSHSLFLVEKTFSQQFWSYFTSYVAFTARITGICSGVARLFGTRNE
jgi:hypothetical protein